MVDPSYRKYRQCNFKKNLKYHSVQASRTTQICDMSVRKTVGMDYEDKKDR